MEPLEPEVREALKRAHPDLTDSDIDRFEELTAQRFALDPETQRREIQRVDQERAAFVEQRMPHYREVATAARKPRPRRERPTPHITWKGQR